jgi:hypothetical protein
VNHWKAKTADNIKALYPSWSESKLNIYLNGSGSGNSWDTGWYANWNSAPLTTTTTTTTTVAPDTTGPNISNFSVSQNTVEFTNNTDRVSITVSADFSDDSGMINYINFAFIQPEGYGISSDYVCAIGANTDVNNGTYSCDMNTSAITGVPLAGMRIKVVDMSDNWTTLDIPDVLTIVYNP